MTIYHDTCAEYGCISFQLYLADVRTAGFNEYGIEGLAATHEKTIALAATKADVGANFRKANLADAVATRREDVHSVVTVAHPACAGPDVAVLIAANPVGKT